MDHVRQLDIVMVNARHENKGGTEMAMISLAGLDKAAVLAALYNASRPQGMGFMHYDPKPMTVDEAQRIGADRYFDYLKGRVMKVDLSGDNLDPYLYDRDNGQGAAEKAINALRDSQDVNTASIKESHQFGVNAAAADLRERLDTSTLIEKKASGETIITMGLDDVKEFVAPKIDKALEDNK